MRETLYILIALSTYLEHGSNTGATCNHTNSAGDVGRVVEVTLGTTDSHGVSNLEFSKQL